MIFIFKRKKIILDCFTYSERIYKLYPLSKASNFFPEWWHNAPKEYALKFYNQATIKKCNGIIDNYKKGFIMPLWTDIAFNVDSTSIEWQTADYQTKIISHDAEQWKFFIDSKKAIHIKINGSWKIKTKSDIKFYLSNPFWNNKLFKNYELCTGIIDFKYNHATNINLFINLIPQKLLLEQNLPIMHFFPLTENDVELKYHLIDLESFNEIDKGITFNSSLNKIKKIINKQEKKCPFGFN